MKPSFYGPIRAREYDIGTDESSIMTFYVEHWKRLGRPEPLIEPMCGTGLNMVWYLQEDVECDGLDASSHMLEQCRRRLKERGFQSRLYEQELENMALDQQYGFMFIPGGSIGHISDNEIATECLSRMFSQLRIGGWLVLDVRQPSFMDHFGEHNEVDFGLGELEDGSTVFTTGFWRHLENGRVIRKWNKMELYINDQLAKTEVFDYRERLYDKREMRKILETAGFKNINVTKSYEHDVVPGSDDGMVFSCQKT